ncbi:MAG: 50S ribosomal protein L11 [Candidatus Altiarchaeota archaeon]|nr:50S ribosomal protein L11 [Candidatus Altiarchaeota archaeon]
MTMQKISVMIDAGKASAGPPLGQALGPLGVSVQNIVAEINKKTAEFQGMQVPVTIKINPTTKAFEIEVGTPPITAIIKKEIGIEKGTSDGSIVGDISLEALVKIAKSKQSKMNAASLKAAVKEAVGTCVSLGVTVDGKHPKKMIKEIDGMDIK